MSDLISREDVKRALVFSEKTGTLKCGDLRNVLEVIDASPSAEPEQTITIHEMACILDELFGNEVACNFNGLDEWLPEICKHKDKCPDVNSVLCWEQYLEHQMEKFNEEP